MEIRTYFHLLCNYSQKYLLIRIPSLPLTKNPNNTFSFPTVQLFGVAVYRVSQGECARIQENIP